MAGRCNIRCQSVLGDGQNHRLITHAEVEETGPVEIPFAQSGHQVRFDEVWHIFMVHFEVDASQHPATQSSESRGSGDAKLAA